MTIKDGVKNSSLAEMIEKTPLNRTDAREFILPKPVSAVEKELIYNNELSLSADIMEFINLLMPTDD